MVMLDLMPVLWAMCAAAALLLMLCGEYGMPARILPAVCAGIALYLYGAPPRLQVLLFAAVYLCAALVWCILRLIGKRKSQNKTEIPR